MRGCIIEANKEDTDHDVLTKKDIKKININLTNDIYYDIQHNLEPEQGCRLIENSITEYPITIANNEINAGSWYCVIEVDNDKLEEMLINGEIKGFSLFSYANGAKSYKEVPDTSDVHPLFISFVKYPANQVLFEVLDKEMYISKMEAVKMADDKSLMDKLRELLNSYDNGEVSKSEEEEIVEEKEEVVEEEVSKSDNSEEESAKEESTEEAKPTEEESEVVAKEDTTEEEKVEEKNEVVKEADMEQNTENANNQVEISNDKILEAMIELVRVINEFRNELVKTNESMVNDVKEPEVATEEPETYIIKQATTKVDKENVDKGTQKKEYFDILGRKL